MLAPIPLRRDFDGSQLRALARKTKDGPEAQRLLALATIYGGATRTEAAKTAGSAFRSSGTGCCASTREGLTVSWDGKSLGQPSKQRQPTPGAGPHDRKRSDPGGPWRGALAADRSGAMDIRGIPHHDRQADAQPGAARYGLPQTLRPTAPPSASSGRHRGF